MDGDDLREWRERHDMTQAELARELGVPQSTISRWETGFIQIERPEMLALALDALAMREGSVGGKQDGGSDAADD